MSIMEQARAHPYLSIGAVVVIGGAFILFLRRGGSGTPGTYSVGDANSVAAATALQNAQLQAQSEGSQIAAQLQAHAGDTAAALQMGQTNAETSVSIAQILADVETSKINATQQLGSLQSTLAAQVATNATNQDTARTAITVGGVTEQQRILADALVSQSANQASVAIAGYDAQGKAYASLASAQSARDALQAQTYAKAISCTGLKALFGGC